MLYYTLGASQVSSRAEGNRQAEDIGSAMESMSSECLETSSRGATNSEQPDDPYMLHRMVFITQYVENLRSLQRIGVQRMANMYVERVYCGHG